VSKRVRLTALWWSGLHIAGAFTLHSAYNVKELPAKGARTLHCSSK
jgi:hypothetical protein